jgi:hypothetical protein
VAGRDYEDSATHREVRVFNRDSVLWWLVIIGALATYLAAMPPPLTWTWAQWMATLAAVVSTVAGKMGSSPLAGAPTTSSTSTTTKTDVTKIAPALLLCLLLPLVTGCAISMKARLEQADAGIYGAVKAIDKSEQDTYDSKALCGAVVCISEATHQKFSKDFLVAVNGEKAYHLAVVAWKPGMPIPVDVDGIGVALKAAGDTIKSAVPAGPNKDAIGLLIDAGAAAVSQVILIKVGGV